MVTKVKGFISSKDEDYKKHSKVLMACLDADISELPIETAEYFGSKFPDEDMLEEKLEVEIPKHVYNAEMTDGFEIIVSEIPKGVHKIRFTNSW